MDPAKEKPKIQLLRLQKEVEPSLDLSAAWARLSKALVTFTELEEVLIPNPLAEPLAEMVKGFDFTFVDSALISWEFLSKNPVPNLCIVQAESFSWSDPVLKAERIRALENHPSLLIESFTAPDLLRILHLFLLPKRLAGVTPLVEKGSLILGEKALDTNKVGSLLDRFAAFAEQMEGFALRDRLPDIRQVLTALVIEGLRLAKSADVVYPYVDFQLSATKQKMAVNLRFPLGSMNFTSLPKEILSGRNIFWSQIWQCSDLTLVTHHTESEELEVMILLCRPEKNEGLGFRTLLFKKNKNASKREDLLDPPKNFTFKVLSEIQLRDSQSLTFIPDSNDSTPGSLDENSELPDLPNQKVSHLQEQARILNEHLARKDLQLQEQSKKHQALQKELQARRGEIVKLTQALEQQREAAEHKIKELEGTVEQLKSSIAAASQPKAAHSSAPMQEMLAKLESTVRAAENEKGQLKESILHEQRKVTALEQKHSILYKDLGQKERELNELKASVTKLKKEQLQKQSKVQTPDESSNRTVTLLKEAEEREVVYRQELKKLNFKLESQEKSIRSIQSDSAEKLKLLDQKLKAAKTKEVELLKRIEELAANLKKATKAA